MASQVRSASSEVGDDVAGVLQDGERDAVLLACSATALGRLAGVGVDRQEDDALGLVLLGQLGQRGAVEVADRAVGAGEDQDDGLLAAKAVERDGLPDRVLEREVGDRRPTPRSIGNPSVARPQQSGRHRAATSVHDQNRRRVIRSPVSRTRLAPRPSGARFPSYGGDPGQVSRVSGGGGSGVSGADD